MKKMNCYRNLLLVLFMLTVVTSCKDDGDSGQISRDVTLSITDEYAVSINPDHQGWKAEIDDPEVIDATMDENNLNIIPKGLGITKLGMLDGNKNELFRMNVEIVATERIYRIDRLFTSVDIKNKSYKDKIEKEMEILVPNNLGTVYELTYNTKNEGKLSVYSFKGNDVYQGTFTEEENDSIIFHYNGSEQRYMSKIGVDPSLPDGSNGYVRYFIKDFTLYFRDKYPEAGVTMVEMQQIAAHTNILGQ